MEGGQARGKRSIANAEMITRVDFWPLRDTRHFWAAWYSFGRKHEALKGSTPAMASGLSDHAWTIKELIGKTAEA
jgi:hypothetical protein